MKIIAILTGLVFITLTGMAGENPKMEKTTPLSTMTNTSQTTVVPNYYIVPGYAAAVIREDDDIVVFCDDVDGSVCVTINMQTMEGCIDPNGCNPNIGPTFYSAEMRDGAVYDIVLVTDEYVKYSLYKVAGSQKKGG